MCSAGAGFFIGDGAGVGKGRQIAGIIMDNFARGRRQAVWLSTSSVCMCLFHTDCWQLSFAAACHHPALHKTLCHCARVPAVWLQVCSKGVFGSSISEDLCVPDPSYHGIMLNKQFLVLQQTKVWALLMSRTYITTQRATCALWGATSRSSTTASPWTWPRTPTAAVRAPCSCVLLFHDIRLCDVGRQCMVHNMPLEKVTAATRMVCGCHAWRDLHG